MAFWGIEVKSGKPFTHKPDTHGGVRLHVSQATLGSCGSTSGKTVVQCNVGKKTPVFLCSLFPEKSETCQLNLEFQEPEDVVFSVVGPHSVHLTGYYLGPSNLPDDHSESFGEDIADTETEKSVDANEEDEYEDSFIDDGELEIFPPSPGSSDLDAEKPRSKRKSKKTKGHRRLKKKYQLIESEDDSAADRHNPIASTAAVTITDSENEDKLPISSVCFQRPATRSTKSVAEENHKKKIVDYVADGEADRMQCKPVLPPEVEAKDEVKQKDFTKEKSPETDFVEDFFSGSILRGVKPKQGEIGGKKLCKDLPVIQQNNEKTVNKRGFNQPNSSLPNIHSDSGSVEKLKKKCKGHKNAVKHFQEECPERKIRECDKDETQKKADDKKSELLEKSIPASTQSGDESEVKPKNKNKERKSGGSSIDSVMVSEVKPKNKSKKRKSGGSSMDSVMVIDMHKSKSNELMVDSINLESNKATAYLNVEHQSAYDDLSRKKKKRKKRTEEDGEPSSLEISLTSTGKGNRSNVEIEEDNAGNKSCQPKISCKLVIDELEMGKPSAQISIPGKKISVRYTCKVKESGQVLHSNIHGDPLKIRMGDQNVSEVWNVGLQGMHVGGKRRLTVPPSMRDGIEGVNIPPNSWLVYDVELLKVR